MYELLLRTEVLFLGLKPLVLLAIGLPALGVGLVLWLGGTRYSSIITGLLGAVVGAAAGLLIGQWLELHLWLSMLVGAAVLATASILLRNALILVLAVLVVAAVSGAGYLAVVLDRMAPPEPETEASAQYAVQVQPLASMDQTARLNYVDEISGEEPSFSERLRAVLDDTWQAVRPHAWKFVLSVVAGGLIAVFLVWLIKKALIALAYSLVGVAAIFMGSQAASLGLGLQAVSALEARPWLLPGGFLTLTGIGWAWQLVNARPRPRKEPAKKEQD